MVNVEGTNVERSFDIVIRQLKSDDNRQKFLKTIGIIE